MYIAVGPDEVDACLKGQRDAGLKKGKERRKERKERKGRKKEIRKQSRSHYQ